MTSDIQQEPLASPDYELVQETKNEIRTLVQEISRLAQAEIPAAQFYGEFLQRVVMAMASAGGAVWSIDADGELTPQYQVNLSQTGATDSVESQTRHRLLLKRILTDGQPALVPPNAGAADPNEPGNPSKYLLVIAPIKVEQRTEGLVEIFQRAGGGPTTQRGYLRFLTQMAEQVSSFLRLTRLRDLGEQQSLWARVEDFLRVVHRSLRSEDIAYTIANDGRELIQCDRVSVLVRRGRKFSCLAVSGVDVLDGRSAEVRRLENLATIVALAGKPVWSDAGKELPPQIDIAFHEYVDQSHSRLLGVIPLRPPADDEHGTRQLKCTAVLVVEKFQHGRQDEGLSRRSQLVAEHGTLALTNALEHEDLFLLPLWQSLGKNGFIERLRQWPKTIVAVALITIAMASIAVIPVDFNLAARGKLRPSVYLEVFAGIDGIVTEVPVRHEQRVKPGDLLVRMTSNYLDSELTKAEGDLRTNEEQLRRLEREQFDHRLKPSEQSRIAGEIAEREQQELTLRQQLSLLQEKRELLELRSPMAGQIVTWRANELLMRRPVQRGQGLLTVIDPDGDWELELFVPERHAGHLAKAWNETGGKLLITFLLSSFPNHSVAGLVKEVRRSTELNSEHGSVVLVRVHVDKSALPELRSDTSVAAKIHCGRRPLGYVLFRDLIETVQTKVLFWL